MTKFFGRIQIQSTVIGFAMALGVSACAPVVDDQSESVHPFVGCWDSEDGLSREGWTIDPSGWLIGYSANRDEQGKVTFFEHMRIERGDGPDRLVVSGLQGAPVAFTRVETENEKIYRFENADHDFPQVITYEPSEGRLDAWISDLNGNQKIPFNKAPCQD